MPANLSPDYHAAEDKYRHAESAQDKIAALEKMFAALPKHKGTEKMQADIRRRLSQARKESQKKVSLTPRRSTWCRAKGRGRWCCWVPRTPGSRAWCAL